MKGSIRLFTGLLIVFGAVGTIDYDEKANLGIQALIAAIGLAIMLWGADAIEQQRINRD